MPTSPSTITLRLDDCIVRDALALIERMRHDSRPEVIQVFGQLADFFVGFAQGSNQLFRIESIPAAGTRELRFTLQLPDRFAELVSALRALDGNLG